MAFLELKDVLTVLITILIGLLTGSFGWLVYEIRMTRGSIDSLNVKIAEVIKDLGYHEKRISVLENKL